MKTLFSTGFRPADPFAQATSPRMGQFDFELPSLPSFPPIGPPDIGLPPPGPMPPAPPPAAPPAPPPAVPPQFEVQPEYLFPVIQPITSPVLACQAGDGTFTLLDPRTLAVLRVGAVEPLNLPGGSTILGMNDPRCAGILAQAKPAEVAAAPAAPSAIPTGVYVVGGLLGLGLLALLLKG